MHVFDRPDSTLEQALGRRGADALDLGQPPVEEALGEVRIVRRELPPEPPERRRFLGQLAQEAELLHLLAGAFHDCTERLQEREVVCGRHGAGVAGMCGALLKEFTQLALRLWQPNPVCLTTVIGGLRRPTMKHLAVMFEYPKGRAHLKRRAELNSIQDVTVRTVELVAGEAHRSRRITRGGGGRPGSWGAD